jgi:peptide chain release factor
MKDLSDLQEIMRSLNVRETDIRERFIASSGPGGQNVNKTATCVYLKHLPTGISVKCQEQRSQEHNRRRARWLLCEKVRARIGEQRRMATARREKLRRQKRRRSAAGKERMLESKRRRSQAKSSRQRVNDW